MPTFWTSAFAMRGGETDTSAVGSQHSRLFSSAASAVGDTDEVVGFEKYFSIAGPTANCSFGGLSYWEAKEEQYPVIFILGGPGAGKGTQSELILKNYPCVHLSAGQLLRDETTNPDSPHATLIEECLVAGKIVPVEISLDLIKNAMANSTGKSLLFLIDGFPRNFDNLDGWTKYMKDVAVVDGALVYDCPLPVLEQRILQRAKESPGRSDDNLESLRKRFKTFETDSMPVIEALSEVQKESSLKVVQIRGDRKLDEVWTDTQSAMNDFLANMIIDANVKLLNAIKNKDEASYLSLCADDLTNATDFSQESESFGDVLGSATNAEINFISGRKATLSYDTSIKNIAMRDVMVWSHQDDKGWRLVHFSRTPQ